MAMSTRSLAPRHLHFFVLMLQVPRTQRRGAKLTHSQLLEGLKCESQIADNRRVRNRGMLPSS
jgi:hypothetical protein